MKRVVASSIPTLIRVWVLFSLDIKAFKLLMDSGENSCLSIIDEAVGMFLKTEVDGTAGAPLELACRGTTLENDSSQTVC